MTETRGPIGWPTADELIELLRQHDRLAIDLPVRSGKSNLMAQIRARADELDPPTSKDT